MTPERQQEVRQRLKQLAARSSNRIVIDTERYPVGLVLDDADDDTAAAMWPLQAESFYNGPED